MSPQGAFGIAEAHGAEGCHRLPRRRETRLPSSAPRPGARPLATPADSRVLPAGRALPACPQTLSGPRRSTQPGRLLGGSEQRSTCMWGHCPQLCGRTSSGGAPTEHGGCQRPAGPTAPLGLRTPQAPSATPVPTCTPAMTGTPSCRRRALEEPQGRLCSTGLGVARGLGFGEAPPTHWWQQRRRVLRSLPRPVTAGQAGWATGPRALGRGLTRVWGQDPQDPQTHCFCKPRA